MKEWSANHPKAKLMAQKRASIVAAAKESFLKDGFSGISMESIAAAAGVSIMTLYRHAENKEDLFNAVLSEMCKFSEEEREAKFKETASLPLEGVLIDLGFKFQKKLCNEETVALVRAVIAEANRFPDLACSVFHSIVGEYKNNLSKYLSIRPETSGLSEELRHQLSHQFFEDLIGSLVLRALFGLPPTPSEEMTGRARYAARKVIKASLT